MRLKVERWIMVGLGVLAGGVASAQTEQSTQTEQQVAPPPDVSAQRDVQLTPEQMVTQAEGHLARMDQGSRNVRRHLTQARQERDVVKVLCLNDKLNQIDVALSSATDRQKALQAMVDANNADRAKHEYTIIAVLRERVETLIAEANQCVGEELGYVGETEVSVDIDPDIPETDPSEFPDDPFISQPPRLRSPTY